MLVDNPPVNGLCQQIHWFFQKLAHPISGSNQRGRCIALKCLHFI